MICPRNREKKLLEKCTLAIGDTRSNAYTKQAKLLIHDQVCSTKKLIKDALHRDKRFDKLLCYNMQEEFEIQTYNNPDQSKIFLSKT